jgi:hypothetical protein
VIRGTDNKVVTGFGCDVIDAAAGIAFPCGSMFVVGAIGLVAGRKSTSGKLRLKSKLGEGAVAE